MAEFCLFVGTAVTAFETVGLVCLEVGDRRYLKPAFLGAGPYFEVECDGGGKAHVAAAETQYVPGEAQFVEQSLHMVFHILQSGIAVFGTLYAHDLHFVELVQTVEATYILAVAACLAAETCRVGAVLFGKLFLAEDHVTVDIGHGHFCRGDKIEVIYLTVVHLSLLVGELSCAVARCCVDHIGRFYLKVTCLVGLVEEELDEGALQACSFTDIYRESGAGDFHTQVEVDEVVFFSEIPVGEGVFTEFRHRAAGFLHHIVSCRCAAWHHGAGEVGDCHKQVVLLLFGLGELLCDSALCLFKTCHLAFGLLGFLAFAFFHK